MTVQSIEERLHEVDRVIIETCSRGCELIRLGAPVAEIDAQTDFLRHLYQRRDLILHEAKKAGITEAAAYSHLRRARAEVI